MSILMTLINIFDIIICSAALCVGIFVVPYSIYSAVNYLYIKIKYWKGKLYENRRVDRRN